jgi:hypothetical protein
MNNQVVEKLKVARALIVRGWCRHSLAQTRFGNRVEPGSDHATRWCAYGALIRAGVPEESEGVMVNLLLDELPPNLKYLEYGIGDYNDDPETTQDAIIALYDRAIAKASC